MRKRYWFAMLIIGLSVMFLAGCGVIALQPPIVTEDVGSLHTAVAETIVVRLTQQAVNTLESQATQLVATETTTALQQPTELPPTETPLPPTATLPPPTPILPSATPVLPTPTNTPIPCDVAQFVADVTVPDYTPFSPGASFTKTWRLKNVGSCTWTTAYAVVFDEGYAMTDKTAFSLPAVVRPGEAVDISINMVTPTKPGNYKGSWMLRNESGRYFGVGPNADKTFWALVKVISSNPDYAYDFTANFCSANWQSGAGKLRCPGNSDDRDGFVVILDNPVLEHRNDDEPALWTNPDFSKDGWIRGKYPSITVKDGYRFKALVGCLAASKGCHVIFWLDYIDEAGATHNLGEWHEVYDGEAYQVDLDLSQLAGQKVQFVLSVDSVGDPKAARAFWFAPRIKATNPVLPHEQENAAIQAALRMVSKGTGIDVNSFSLVSLERIDWTDNCLGIPRIDQECTPAQIPGYRIVLKAGNHQYETHTNLDGSEVRWFEISS